MHNHKEKHLKASVRHLVKTDIHHPESRKDHPSKSNNQPYCPQRNESTLRDRATSKVG